MENSDKFVSGERGGGKWMGIKKKERDLILKTRIESIAYYYFFCKNQKAKPKNQKAKAKNNKSKKSKTQKPKKSSRFFFIISLFFFCFQLFFSFSFSFSFFCRRFSFFFVSSSRAKDRVTQQQQNKKKGCNAIQTKQNNGDGNGIHNPKSCGQPGNKRKAIALLSASLTQKKKSKRAAE
jgi:hypothetical protein